MNFFILLMLAASGIIRTKGAEDIDCMLVLLQDEFRVPCSRLPRDFSRPCLVMTDADVTSLKRTMVLPKVSKIGRSMICANYTRGEGANCFIDDREDSKHKDFEWTPWSGTSRTPARSIMLIDGTTRTTCPYEERYEKVFADCTDAYLAGERTSGIFRIDTGKERINVYCEQERNGGGWLVFQKRFDGSVSFLRTWDEYKDGFGQVDAEHWLGNDRLHLLTRNHDQRLLVKLQEPGGHWANAEYSELWINDESDLYRLHVNGYSGAVPPGNSMSSSIDHLNHNGQPFSTKDHDNEFMCAKKYKGGWWYKGCHAANLNGLYGSTKMAEGLCWFAWKGPAISMKSTTMMIKKKT